MKHDRMFRDEVVAVACSFAMSLNSAWIAFHWSGAMSIE